MSNREIIASLPINHSKYKKGHIEKDFQADIFTWLRKKWWICHHIADVGLWTKFLDAICINPDWDTVYLEFKQIVWYTFNMSMFQPSQVVLFTKLLNRPNVEAYVPVYSQKTKSYVLTTYKQLLDSQDDKWGIKLFDKV